MSRFARVFTMAALAFATSAPLFTAEQPNILWITVEDMSPHLGCWGDRYSITPNIDKLARQSVRYVNAFATAPICSPVRSCLITGVHATSLGTHNLRSNYPIPAYMTGFPSYLRKRGYHCTNNVKTDYNTANEKAIIAASWDESSAQAHWRGRKDGQPFFAVFNDMTTHQSRTTVWTYEQFRKRVQSKLSRKEIHDPAKVPLPPYYPDTPVVRREWARYYDCITVMDKNVGRLLGQLDQDGLADDTIVFFYSDHGAGMPRHKRLCLDSGLRVPLLVRFPEKWRHLAPAGSGQTLERLVSFVDFGPTVLSLCGVRIPKYMQGRPFLGAAAAAPRAYVFAARGRVDEAYDFARTVRDKRFLYTRTYMPHLSYNQPSVYSDYGELRNEITRLAAAGKLKPGPQTHYGGPTRAIEELYDSQSDPQQLVNLAGSPEHRGTLARMRARLGQWIEQTGDLGFLPEIETWERSRGSTPYEMRGNKTLYPQASIMAAADLAGRGPDVAARQIERLRDPESAVRYWAALGLGAQKKLTQSAMHELLFALSDSSPTVRIEAASALARHGHVSWALPLLTRELQSQDPDRVLASARALELMGGRARPVVRLLKTIRGRWDKNKPGPLPLFIRFSLDAALAN